MPGIGQTSSIEASRARLRLSELRVGQTKQLAVSGAGDLFEAQRWESDVAQQRADLVVVEGDPYDFATLKGRISAVYQDGRLVAEAERELVA